MKRCPENLINCSGEPIHVPNRAVLVCNGSLDTKWLYPNIQKGDFIVAVDGGANKLMKTSFRPDAIIGDMDSITKAAAKKFRFAEFVRFPREKAQVDLELAINYCLAKGFGEILILGALGSRADMALTNVFILSQVPEGVKASIVHENQEIFLVPKKFPMEGVPGEVVSFFPIGGDVRGLSLRGFKYGLDNYDLRFGTGIGVSNEFKSKKASISFKDGLLLCVHFHKWL